ncbi:MAG: hypothetical protein QNJ46_05255 [Leptolyngbyaceae cyanobacterium MO_188.B28]|nr:hypothetical protein [Leptolyngbyaceae cyanobacterium MO_188.B28]
MKFINWIFGIKRFKRLFSVINSAYLLTISCACDLPKSLTPLPTSEPLTPLQTSDRLNTSDQLNFSDRLNTFESRAEKLLAEFSTTNVDTRDEQYSKYAFWYAQALFHRGEEDLARGVVDLAHERIFEDYSFYYWGLIDSYFRWQALYSEAQKAKAKQRLLEAEVYDSGKTENHKIMLAAARFLASEEWPDEEFAGNYSPDDPAGRSKILKMMSDFVIQGMVEHDSPVYHAMYLGAFRTLADFAKDEEIKYKAQIIFEWLLINPSGEWLDGHWAASSLRKFPLVHRQNEYGAGQYVLWLFLGGKDPASFSVEAAYSVQHAVASYRVPEMIQDIAQQRQSPYIHRAYDRWEGNDDQFFKTTYMAPEGAIYSQFEEQGDKLGWSAQGHRWGIVWTESDQDSIFWVTHPKKRRGITDYEQVLQHNKTIIGVYNIPADNAHKYVIGRTPQGFIDYIDHSEQGAIYLDYGTVMIGLSLFTIASNGERIGFDWSSQDTKFQGPRFIPQGKLKIGLVAVAAFRGEFANLTDFSNALNFTDHIDDSQILDRYPRIKYIDLDGNILDIRFDRLLKVNHRDIDTQSWPLMENPWTTYPQGGNLKLTLGSRVREYIFGPEAWRIETHETIR